MAMGQRLHGRVWLSLPVLAVLLSCGGGDSEPGKSANSSNSADDAGRAKALAFVPPVPIPADANVNGMWSPVYAWPVIAVHSVLMPDGRVLTYGSDTTGLQTGHANVDVWDNVG